MVLKNIFIENKKDLSASYKGIGVRIETSDCTLKDYVSVNMHICAFVGGATVVDNVHPYCGSPIFENSKEIIKDISYNKAHELYGDPLPDIVKERLDTELNGII